MNLLRSVQFWGAGKTLHLDMVVKSANGCCSLMNWLLMVSQNSRNAGNLTWIQRKFRDEELSKCIMREKNVNLWKAVTALRVKPMRSFHHIMQCPYCVMRFLIWLCVLFMGLYLYIIWFCALTIRLYLKKIWFCTLFIP